MSGSLASQQSLTTHEYRPLSVYRSWFPGARQNALMHLATLIRWATRGILQPDGTRLKLRGIRAGSRWLTTDEWVREFIDALTSAHTTSGDTATPRSPAERNRASADAAKKLRALGA